MLLEWRNVTINLKSINYISRDYKTLKLEIQFPGDEGNILQEGFESIEEMDKYYLNLIKSIKSLGNFETDMDGHFLCSHCGAPN